MGCRTYEADKEGRITIYPSLNRYGRISPGLLKALVNKLVNLTRRIRKNSTGTPQV